MSDLARAATVVTAATAAPAAPLLARDEILDNTYRIVDGLASGGIGEVYRAVHLRVPRALAIKTLQPEFAARKEWIARFCREACVLGQLRHPNIVQVVDFNVSASGVPYIAMELVEGEDLGAALARGESFDAPAMASIVRQIASALDAAHAAGVVHRDLKPENVVLAPAAGQLPVVKVIDFGMSTREGSERVTGDCTVFGTPEFMAPEQAQGLRDEVDGRTDQFALAALAYKLLTGRAPFERETPVAVLYAIVHDEPAPLGDVEGWDLAPVERVLRRGMARARDDRYASVLEFADAFEDALAEVGALPKPATPLPLRLVSSPTKSTRSLPAPRRSRAVLPAFVLSLLVAFAIVGGLARTGGPNAVQTVRSGVTAQWQRLRSRLPPSPTPRPPEAIPKQEVP
jgi:serine/threonine-protein kinase